MAALERYSGNLLCPRCRRTGDAVWEEIASPGPKTLIARLRAPPEPV
jgi:hypothetical protein